MCVPPTSVTTYLSFGGVVHLAWCLQQPSSWPSCFFINGHLGCFYLWWKRWWQHGSPVPPLTLLSFLGTDGVAVSCKSSVLNGFEELPYCCPAAWHFMSPAAMFMGSASLHSQQCLLFTFWFVTAVLLDACFVIAVLLGAHWHCIVLLTVVPEG